jgi:hypothetical protein
MLFCCQKNQEGQVDMWISELPDCTTEINAQSGGEELSYAGRGIRIMERELDAHDLQLLKAAAAAGQIVPKNIHQQRRLDRLDLEGYVESSRQGPAEGDSPSSWVYRLTRKGERAAERPHS